MFAFKLIFNFFFNLIQDTSSDKKILKIIECLDSKESSASFHSIVVSTDRTKAQTFLRCCLFIWIFSSNFIQEAEEEGVISEDLCKKEETPSSVYVTPPVGTLADYPYCVTPQQTVLRLKLGHLNLVLTSSRALRRDILYFCYSSPGDSSERKQHGPCFFYSVDAP